MWSHALDDIDEKVTHEVVFDDLPSLIPPKGQRTMKTFHSVVEGPDAISDGHWYISEPLKPGHYQGITKGTVPTGNFWEKTKYDVTVDLEEEMCDCQRRSLEEC